MKAVKLILTVLVFGTAFYPQEPNGQWGAYGGDPSSSRYSRLTQINKSNVQQLKVAWDSKIGDEPQVDNSVHSFEATPLMIDDVLYLPTPHYHVVALEASTGKKLWDYDTHLFEWGPGVGPVIGISRGISTWTDGKQRRIILAARGQLFALNAQTGKLIPSFGKEGVVDTTQTLIWKLKDRTHYFNSSPPVVFKNLIIVGSSTPDGTTYYQNPPGDVQAFDVLTGKQVWSFHTIPQPGEFGNDTWENESWKFIGHANVWPPITLDEKNGLVFLPVTEPSNDYYGGQRKGNNLFSDSLVCLDANTGKRKWHFQTVHHDIWDYDGVMGANLFTLHVNGKTVEAVAAVSKTGFTYVFDRLTGEPVWAIEERPVPQTDVPGEKTSPTQPFPTKPPPFAKQGFRLNEVVDFTPEIKAMALEKVKGYREGSIFNPPSIQGTFMIPSNVGGANWGGAAADPDNGVLYIKAENILQVIKIIKKFNEGEDLVNIRPGSESSRDSTLLTPMIDEKIPINKPPYATITAMDLNRGEILWQEANGDMAEVRNHPLLKGLNIPPTGMISRGMGFGRTGPIVTAGGLLFIGPGDHKLYARDKDNGKILWTADLKNDVAGNPMTYQTSSGQQFVVVATGIGKDASLVAFGLPQASQATRPATTKASQETASNVTSTDAKDWSVFLPEDRMKPIALKCGTCHGLEMAVNLRGDASFWQDLVGTMKSYGFDIQKDESEELIKYFSKYFDNNRPSLVLPIDLNTANASTLGLLSPLAAHVSDILKSRNEKAFGSVNDLLKVKGISKDDVEKVRAFVVAANANGH